MKEVKFFRKSKLSEKALAGGPEGHEVLQAMAEDRYWSIIGTKHLQLCHGDEKFNHRTNAVKNAIQVYGPMPAILQRVKYNPGTENSVWHVHVENGSGKEYVLEWGVVDEKRRVIAILNFASHENYSFIKKPISETQKKNLLSDPYNTKRLDKIDKKIIEAKKKVERVELNFRHQIIP